MQPLVSVIIPTYNQATYLPLALDSVLQQTYSHLEIIIIDDGSTDDTSQIGKIYRQKEARIRWVEQPNQGPSTARNLGVAEANGDFICFLDSDDLMHPQRIEKQHQTFQEDPSIDIVYTALQVIDSNNHVTGEMHSEDYPQKDFLALMLFRNLIHTSSTMMGKSRCFKEFLFDGTFKHAEDYELSLRLAHHFHFKYLDVPLTLYRRHGTNLSNNLQAHRQAEMKILRNYSKRHIEDIVDQTSFSPEGKLLLKGRILFNQESFEDALHYFRQVHTGLALFYKGNCFLRLQQPEAANAVYQQALVLDPSNAACWNNLGATYALEGHFERARECFQQALENKPGYLDAAFNLNQANNQGKEGEKEWRITWRELRKNLLPYSTA